MGAMVVAFLRLPLSAIVIASLLCASAGPGAGPLVIVGVVVSYLATLALEGRIGQPGEDGEPESTGPSVASPQSVGTADAG
jgi:chloride channel protein, CIC family